MTTPVALILAFLKADVPVLMWGAPGTGKTATILAMADQENAHAEVLIGSTLDPIDVGGYLVPQGERVMNVPPPWAMRLKDALDKNRPAWLILDELSCAPPSVQAALLRVVNERRVGALDLDGIRVIAAANPSETAADGGELAAATANRWAHVDWSPDVVEWCSGTLNAWGKGYKTKDQERIAVSVANYIHSNPRELLAVPERQDQSGRAWPSPRSWTAAIRAAGQSPDQALALMRACVGQAADGWHAYNAAKDLPDPEDILSGKKPVPKQGHLAAIVLSSMAVAAMNEREDRSKRIQRAWEIILNARPDLAILAARTLCSTNVPKIAEEYAQKLRRGGVQ